MTGSSAFFEEVLPQKLLSLAPWSCVCHMLRRVKSTTHHLYSALLICTDHPGQVCMQYKLNQ